MDPVPDDMKPAFPLPGTNPVDLDEVEISREVIALVPPELARRLNIIPIHREDNTVTVAQKDPIDFDALDTLRYVLKADVVGVWATPESVERAISRHYPTE